LKYLSTPVDPHRGVDFVTECFHCKTSVRGPQCTNASCKRVPLNCVICRVFVKGNTLLLLFEFKACKRNVLNDIFPGSASFCLVCGHGGHGKCMSHWFAEEGVCPTGCGCNCLLENNTVFSV